MEFRNKKVTVVGLGESGFESSLLLLRAGAIPTVTDAGDGEHIRKRADFLADKRVKVEIGRHSEGSLKTADLLVVSPGVESASLPIRYAQEKGIPVIGELELGYSFCKGRIVAVTGTNGKSTVVSLLGEVLRRAGIPVCVCGNIGNPLSGEAQHIEKGSVVVLEVSSFQLERITSFRPGIAVMLNITPDHLDRHRSFEEYRGFKARIFENQKKPDIAVLNHKDDSVRKLADSGKIRSKISYFNNGEKFNADSKLNGAHNRENILAAGAVAEALGVKTAVFLKAVEAFQPLGHRFEKIAEIGGVEYIDDSKATNVDSTYKALISLKRRTVLIAGGKDKDIPYEKVLPALKNKVKKIILIGETQAKMRGIFKDFAEVSSARSLEDAVRAARESALPGESVLLSPMCASFDMFRDYKERGEVFCEAVRKLCKQEDV